MMLLRRNRFGFRMRRRNFTNRLLQCLVMVGVVMMFLYVIFSALQSGKDSPGPDFSWLKSRNMSFYIRPFSNTTLVLPKQNGDEDICGVQTSLPEKLRLLVMVFSHPASSKKRRVIRQTWAKDILKFPGVRFVFVLGTSSRVSKTEIRRESDTYNDLVQHDFVDSHLNLTFKTAFAFKWALHYCFNSKFILKVEEDVFVNTEELWGSLDHALLHTTTTSSLQNFIPDTDDNLSGESVDYLFMGSVMMAVPVRDVRSKWYLPNKFYPLNIFPKFLSGTGYVLTSSILPMLYQCLLRTPFMNLEDVFLSGICGTTQMGLHLSHHPGFLRSKPFLSPNYVCYYKRSAMVHGVTSQEMAEMWVKIREDYNCDTFYYAFARFVNGAVDLIRNLFRF